MAPPSVPPAMTERSTPKTMSSRLMTMKFMQRGAAQAAAETSSPSTPKTEDEGSASKRRKTSHKSAPPTPTPSAPIYDQKAIQAALEEEEKKRLSAIEKRASELGDSHWVLDASSVPAPKNGARVPLNVVQVGFGQIDYTDTHDDDHDGDHDTLRTVDNSTKARSQFNMKKSKTNEKEDNNSSDSGSELSGDGSEDSEGSSDPGDEPGRGRQDTEATPSNKKRARSSMSARRSEERKKAQEFAEKRRKKEVNLNKLKSISGGGSQTSQKPNFNCHSCGKPGHRAADCPKRRR